MWVEINLVAEVVDSIAGHILFHQRDRYDQGNESPAIFLQHPGRFSPLAGHEAILHMFDRMLQYVGVFTTRRWYGQRLHEEHAIPLNQVPRPMPISSCNEVTELLSGLPVVGEQQNLVGRMKRDNVVAGERSSCQRPPSVIAEHSFDKIIAEHRIAKPSFIFDWDQRKPFHKGTCEHTYSVPTRFALPVEDPHTFDPATRRIPFKDIAGQISGLEQLELALRQHRYRLGHIPCSRDRHESRGCGVANQSHGLARRPQPRFDFRTNRDPFDIAAENPSQESVALVPPVVTDMITKQTAADADAYRIGVQGLTSEAGTRVKIDRNVDSSSGNRNWYPPSRATWGRTRCPVVRKEAISPNVSRRANSGTGNQDGRFNAFPKALQNARMVTGPGATAFTGPDTFSFSNDHSIKPMRSAR